MVSAAQICEIDWHSLSQHDYMQRLLRIKFSNLLASPLYAKIEAKRYNYKIDYGLIRLSGIEAGLALRLQGKTILGLKSYSILHRVPLWFEGFENPVHDELFWRAVQQNDKGHFLQKYSIIPEYDFPLLSALFKPRIDVKPYQTLYLDLTVDLARLRQNFRKTWRHDLIKAENSDLVYDAITDTNTLKTIIALSDHHRKVKAYKAPKRAYLNDLCMAHFEENACVALLAKHRNEILAGIILLIHGASATYQLGYSSAKGRSMRATHLLLWQGIKMLQERGIKSLDLGGIHDDAPSLTLFKTGLGGRITKIGGLYV